jgi:hypothetical protein
LVATPSAGFGLFNHPCPYWVEYHISAEFKKVILFLYQDCPEPSLKDVASLVVPSVISLGI